MSSTVENRYLVCRIGTVLCALPLDCVRETMRPLPVEPVAGMPPFVRGVSIVRGLPAPVVDVATLLGEPDGVEPARFVTVHADDRSVALAVDEVLGIRELSPAALQGVPPLVSGANERVSALGSLDEALLVVLRAARLMPEDVWQAIARLESTT